MNLRRHPERITPEDYRSDDTRRRIADACMAAVGANRDDVCRIDVTDAGATVWEYVNDPTTRVGWVPVLCSCRHGACDDVTFLMRRRSVRL